MAAVGADGAAHGRGRCCAGHRGSHSAARGRGRNALEGGSSGSGGSRRSSAGLIGLHRLSRRWMRVVCPRVLFGGRGCRSSAPSPCVLQQRRSSAGFVRHKERSRLRAAVRVIRRIRRRGSNARWRLEGGGQGGRGDDAACCGGGGDWPRSQRRGRPRHTTEHEPQQQNATATEATNQRRRSASSPLASALPAALPPLFLLSSSLPVCVARRRTCCLSPLSPSPCPLENLRTSRPSAAAREKQEWTTEAGSEG